MRLVWRKSVTMLALYAVALHVILLGLFPASVVAPINPFAVICHTTGPAAKPGEPPPGTLRYLPSRAFDHCDVCSAAAPPPAPDAACKVDFRAARVLHVLRPVSTAAQVGLAFDPNPIRGPPVASS